MTALVTVDDLTVRYELGSRLSGRRSLDAVSGVSFRIGRGETFGLVGESGSGKSTVGKAILRVAPTTSGSIVVDGTDISSYGRHTPLCYRRVVQVIMQDPTGALNRRQSIGTTLEQVLVRHRLADRGRARSRCAELLDMVGLATYHLDRYPHELSGGQRQRVAIARAVAVEPALIVCDEAVSALDVNTQSQIVNLLLELQREMNTAYLFIDHDLELVRHVSHSVGVMYQGRLVECGASDTVYAEPSHPYTRTLLDATLVADPHLARARRENRVVQTQRPVESAIG